MMLAAKLLGAAFLSNAYCINEYYRCTVVKNTIWRFDALRRLRFTRYSVRTQNTAYITKVEDLDH